MESESLPTITARSPKHFGFGKLFGILVFILLVLAIGYLYFQVELLKTQLAGRVPGVPIVTQSETVSPDIPLDLSAYATLSDITLLEERLNKNIESVELQSSVQSQPVATSPVEDVQVSYIQIPGSFSTTSLDWVDVPGTDVYIDKYSDYGDNAIITWEAFIHTEHGNGETHVRLFDVTHSIGVDRSEISSNSSSTKLVISQSLPLWKGNNLYRVQVKSQSGFASFFDSGRIKVTR